MDIVIDDPFASREHCVVELIEGTPTLVDSDSRNGIRLGDHRVKRARLAAGDRITLGTTAIWVRGPGSLAEATTRTLHPSASNLTYRPSTRELLNRDGGILAAFSPNEAAAFEALARVSPDALSHEEIGFAVWEGDGFDQYQIHRLIQRVRRRLGAHAGLVQNVRGSGYGLAEPIEIV